MQSRQINIGELFFGQNDGKKEAKYRPDFERFFFDYNQVFEKLKKKSTFLVLGRKGSGKTILGEFFKKTEENESNTCEIIPFKEFNFHEMLELASGEIKPNQYIAIWEWVVLIHFAKFLCDDETITLIEDKRKLNTFFEDNYNSVEIDAKKIVERTNSNEIKGEAFNTGFASKTDHKLVTPGFIFYLEDLRQVVIRLLENSRITYTLFYDELDDRFRDNDQIKDALISLVKAVDKTNLYLYDKSNSKIVLLLRSDIFYLLNDPDLNKIKRDNAIQLDWGHRSDANSPILEMIIEKAKRSVKEFEDLSNESVFNILFPHQINGFPPEKFILERTLFRPRDVITMLNMIADKYPRVQFFGSRYFLDILPSYSEYFLQEIRNELSGHISDVEVDQGTLLLKQFNRREFAYPDLYHYYTNNKSMYPDLQLEKTLKIFFKYSIIGNKWYVPEKRLNYYSWAYRDNKSEIDIMKTIVIHLGLKAELSL